MRTPHDTEPTLAAIAQRALEFVQDGMVVGLGTGRAATAFVRALGARVRQGLRITGVPTSHATSSVANEYGIPLVGLEEIDGIDVTVDGADEVDPQLDMIKGYGGALVPEKIVAAASRMEIILVGSEKLVPVLGRRGRLPVEVIPFALGFCRKHLVPLGCRPEIRMNGSARFVSDSGNFILDCGVDPISKPHDLESAIRAIPGVVGTGLFLDIADLVLVADDDTMRELRRPG